MHPIHDVDVLLLLATALAAKRRPAAAVDIVAAIDLLQGNIPGEDKLSEAFSRLAAHGLLHAADDGFALTPAAQKMIETLPHKGETAERLFRLKDALSIYTPQGAHPSVEVAPESLRAAILAHRAASQGSAKNLLVPKPKPAAPTGRPGQRQRKPLPARRRKD